MCHLLEHFANVTVLDACLLSFLPWYIFMNLNCSIWVAQLMEFYSAVLFCRKLAPVPTVRNYSMLMEFWQVSLALPSSCVYPSYSVLCTSRPSSRPPSRIHLKIADFATEELASVFMQISSYYIVASKLTVSLYNLAILHSTLYLWVLCWKSAVVCH